MPQYLIRRNINGRIIGQATETASSDQAAILIGMQTQDRINRQWDAMTGNRGPCPKVEVLQVLWTGVPSLSQTPAAITGRKYRTKKRLEMLDELHSPAARKDSAGR